MNKVTNKNNKKANEIANDEWTSAVRPLRSNPRMLTSGCASQTNLLAPKRLVALPPVEPMERIQEFFEVAKMAGSGGRKSPVRCRGKSH